MPAWQFIQGQLLESKHLYVLTIWEPEKSRLSVLGAQVLGPHHNSSTERLPGVSPRGSWGGSSLLSAPLPRHPLFCPQLLLSRNAQLSHDTQPPGKDPELHLLCPGGICHVIHTWLQVQGTQQISYRPGLWNQATERAPPSSTTYSHILSIFSPPSPLPNFSFPLLGWLSIKRGL